MCPQTASNPEVLSPGKVPPPPQLPKGSEVWGLGDPGTLSPLNRHPKGGSRRGPRWPQGRGPRCPGGPRSPAPDPPIPWLPRPPGPPVGRSPLCSAYPQLSRDMVGGREGGTAGTGGSQPVGERGPGASGAQPAGAGRLGCPLRAQRTWVRRGGEGQARASRRCALEEAALPRAVPGQ